MCLASVYSQEPVRDGRKAVHHLKMAAERGVSAPPSRCFQTSYQWLDLRFQLPCRSVESHRAPHAGHSSISRSKHLRSHVSFRLCSQDDSALLLLGQCFEKGFGVRRNLTTAVEYYSRAARAGNKQAKRLLTPPGGSDLKGASKATSRGQGNPNNPSN